MWGDLSWLTARGYTKSYDADEHRPETWIKRSEALGRRTTFWHELVIRFTGAREGKDYGELSCAILDSEGCMVSAAIDEIGFTSLKDHLDLYEQRVLAMLELGLRVGVR
jgi:hypothetical protein